MQTYIFVAGGISGLLIAVGGFVFFFHKSISIWIFFAGIVFGFLALALHLQENVSAVELIEANEAKKKQEGIPLDLIILFKSHIYPIHMKLHYSWSWEITFNFAVSAFVNNPDPKKPENFLPDLSKYRAIDLNSDSWFSPPATADELRTNRIALVYISDVNNSFPEIDDSLKCKALAFFIKETLDHIKQ